MKLHPASVKRRLLAFVLDMFFMGIILLFLFVLVFALSEINDTVGMVCLWIVFGLYLFYYPLCETFFHGKTIGKLFTNLQVVRVDGSPASGVHCMQRYMFLPIDTVMSLGIVGLTTTMITRNRQRLGDIVADTMVVYMGRHAELDGAVLSDFSDLSPVEKDIFSNTIAPDFNGGVEPLEVASQYRAIQSGIATLRTHKARPAVIEYMESVLGYVHVKMFGHTSYSVKDIAAFTLRSVPAAMYSARWSIAASLLLSVIAFAIGVYSQMVDPSFAEGVLGSGYVRMTLDNIAEGRPLDVYSSSGSSEMFFTIFFNNLLVDLRGYMFGIIIFVGPIFFIINNFVMAGCFFELFAQHGYLFEAVIGINQHGVFELSTIVIVMGAAIHFGVSVLFPGERTRLKALARGARESLMILISTIPVTLAAAFLESYVTRHVEWPLAVRLLVLVVSSVIILGYYVVLPTLAKRH